MSAALQVVELLNKLLDAEPEAVTALFDYKVPFEDPDGVSPFYNDENCTLSVLGIINGIITEIYPEEGQCVSIVCLPTTELHLTEFTTWPTDIGAATGPESADAAMSLATDMLQQAFTMDPAAITALFNHRVAYKDTAGVVPRMDGNSKVTELSCLMLVNIVMRTICDKTDKWIYATQMATSGEPTYKFSGFYLLPWLTRWCNITPIFETFQ